MNRAIFYSTVPISDSKKEILAEFEELKKEGYLPKDAVLLYAFPNVLREMTEVVFKAEVIRNIVDREELYQWRQGDLPEIVGIDEKIY